MINCWERIYKYENIEILSNIRYYRYNLPKIATTILFCTTSIDPLHK